MNEIPNDGLLTYRFLFNAERVVPTSPKALGEVLVQKSYDFVKPSQLVNGLGRLLGIGILLAEGEEHKVTDCHPCRKQIIADRLIRPNARI